MVTLYYTYYKPVMQKEKRSREHQLGRSLLAMGLRELYGISIPSSQIDSYLSANEYEKPYLGQYPHIHFNISHCEQLVACGFFDHELGIDVEDIAPFRETIFRRVLTPSEQEFLLRFQADESLYREYFCRFWTLKESRIKEAGLGLAMPMTDFSFQIDTSTIPPRISCSQKEVFFYQTKLDTQRILSLCSQHPIDKVVFRQLPQA